jgi:glycosyltransferase involved in cell wall biosynthesis
MHLLLISSYLGPTIGGTETLIARMSKWLLGQGLQVTLLTNSVGGYRELFPAGLRIIEAGDQLFELCFWHKSEILWRRLQIETPDVIKAFDLIAAWISTILASRMHPAPKVLFGNYVPYIFPRSRNPIKQHTRRLLLRNLMRSFMDESILCMAREQIVEFQSHYGTHRKINFWPLPIEDPSVNGPPRVPRWGHIVSIGRLDPMKKYNLTMIDIVARLRAQSLPVTWTVYGDGKLHDMMRARIDKLGLNDAIQLKGDVAYPRIAAALQDAYVFVGMGTAIIEAALCGVPAVVALAYEAADVTYGPLYRFTFGNLGERMPAPPDTTIEIEIERVLGLSKLEYQQEVQKTVEYAKGYEMEVTMKAFLAFVEKATPPKPCRALFYWFYIDSFVNRVFNKSPAGASPEFYSKGRR